MSAIRVDLGELRQSILTLLDHVASVEGPTVDLPQDYFWSIPSDELYEGRSRPGDLTIGQLSESLENLRTMRENDSMTVSFGMVWLADILRAVGHHAKP